jgi:hypothetical protein
VSILSDSTLFISFPDACVRPVTEKSNQRLKSITFFCMQDTIIIMYSTFVFHWKRYFEIDSSDEKLRKYIINETIASA